MTPIAPTESKRQSSVFAVPGMRSDVTVTVDSTGVSHIRASSAADVFLAQGYVAARDRLFQMDLWMRRGLGRLAEAFGPQWVEKDQASRAFLFRGDPIAERQAYGPRGVEAMTSFAAGVNAYIAHAQARDSLPPEFGRLGHQPLEWAGEDISRIRVHGLYENALQELIRSRTLSRWGAGVDALRRSLEPATTPTAHADAQVGPDALALYELASGPVRLGDPNATRNSEPAVDGSNNWVLDGSRTASGRPLLANDPHRAMTLPSLRYVVHLSCPEFDVIGAGEPFLPGVSIGHNAEVAFGLTYFPTDQEDVFVYRLDPADSERYWHGGAWRRFERVEEVIPVCGKGEEVRLNRFSVHGPVTSIDANAGTAVAVAAVWLEPGMAPYLSSLRYLDATDVHDVRKALSQWGAPTANHVFADRSGQIGWQASGRTPVRQADGLTPVPGDGRFDWTGSRGSDDLPGLIDPDEGWIATANQRQLPDGATEPASPVGYEWLAPYRYLRISEELRRDRSWTTKTARALQMDVVSVPAQRICGVLRGLPLSGLSQSASQALRLLAQWDHRMTEDSPAAALFETWFRGPLRRALLTRAVIACGVDAVDEAVDTLDPTDREEAAGDPQVDLKLFDELAASPSLLAEVVDATLTEAVDHLNRQQDQHSPWQWGRFHTMRFTHPADEIAPDWSLPPVPKSGSPDTVAVSSRRADGSQTTGAGFRFVTDVGDWDDSWFVNAPGQDGRPGRKHYQDHVQPWRAGEYLPLAYTESRINALAEWSYTLAPGG